MSWGETAVWVGLMAAGLGGSAIWSGTETGFYCLSRVRLDVRLHRSNDRAARRVREELEHPNRLLSTILLGNNVCNYLGTLGLAMLLDGAGLGPGVTALLQMVVLTPLFLILGESLPKEVFRLNADSWPYALSPVVKGVRLLATVTLILPLLMSLSRLALRLAGEPPRSLDIGGRRRLLGLLAESAHAGSISGVQGALAERALVFERTKVADVMVPWRRVDRLRTDWEKQRAISYALRTTRTWLPLTDRLGRIRGIVHALDMLGTDGEPGTPTGPELFEPLLLGPGDPVRTAIGRLTASRAGIAVVHDGVKPVGLVGREDLVGPLLAKGAPRQAPGRA